VGYVMGGVALGRFSLNNSVFLCQYQSTNTPHMLPLAEGQTGKAFEASKSNAPSEIGEHGIEK
jgi:hypothetical protein